MVSRPNRPRATAGDCTHSRFRQTHRGLPIHFGTYVVVECGGRVVGGFGAIIEGLNSETGPAIDQDSAIQLALGQDGAIEQDLDLEPKSVELGFWVPNPKSAKTARLSYLINFGFMRSIVDAESGRIIEQASTSRNLWSEVLLSGETIYNIGTVNFLAEVDDSGPSYRLRSNNVPSSVTTLNGSLSLALPGNSGTIVSLGGDDYSDSDGSYDTEIQRIAMTAHWAAQGTLLYFEAAHDWTGLDGLGRLAPIYLDIVYQSQMGSSALPCGVTSDSMGEGRRCMAHKYQFV